MAALNIQIDVPNMGIYDMEELKHKVVAYAKKLISSSQTKETVTSKTYNHEVLAGIFAEECTSADDLRSDYIHEKYGL